MYKCIFQVTSYVLSEFQVVSHLLVITIICSLSLYPTSTSLTRLLDIVAVHTSQQHFWTHVFTRSVSNSLAQVNRSGLIQHILLKLGVLLLTKNLPQISQRIRSSTTGSLMCMCQCYKFMVINSYSYYTSDLAIFRYKSSLNMLWVISKAAFSL